MANMIERKINFYMVEFKRDGDNVPPHTIFSSLQDMSFDEDGRYFELSNGELWSMEVDSLSNLNIKMGTIRRDDLPLIEQRGDKQPLTIPQDSGLYEPMHFKLYVNTNEIIGGFEYNHYGPKVNNIKPYLEDKIDDLVDEVEVTPLVRKDISELLARVGEIRMFDFRVHKNFLGLDDIIFQDALEALASEGESERIQIILRPEQYAKQGVELPFPLNRLAELLSRSEVRSEVERAKLRARDKETSKITEVDLLQEYLTKSKQVVKRDDEHNYVRSDAMYAAIHEAYQEFENEIEEILRPE